ncbi:GPI transamidase GPI16 [Pelomyxa schiedti]|nr:GPI transamidase GPI16 [Pelomyxa schiedti]
MGAGLTWRWRGRKYELAMMTTILLVVGSSLCGGEEGVGPSESWYEEALVLRPLVPPNPFDAASPSPRVEAYMAYLQFNVTTAVAQLEEMNYNLFPKSLARVLLTNSVHDMRLSLTQSRWLYDKWGYPPVAAPLGAELWVEFTSRDINVDAQWKQLRNALSGLVCGSFNLMDEPATCKPVGLHHRSAPTLEGKEALPRPARYGVLPREAVCTENLTPLLKLLPCRGKVGLGVMLSPYALFNMHYNSMSLIVHHLIFDDKPYIQFLFTYTVVIDSNGGFNIDQMIPKGTVLSACPVSSKSNIIVEADTNVANLTPKPHSTVVTPFPPYKAQVFNLKESPVSTLSITTPLKQSALSIPSNIPVTAHQYLTGHGDERGGIVLNLQNHEGMQSSSIDVLQIFPFFVRPYISSLTLKLDDQQLDYGAFNWFNMSLGNGEEPSIFEWGVTLPPKAELTVSIQFEKVFLHIDKHPPDAHRGWDLPSTVVSAHVASAGNSYANVRYDGWHPSISLYTTFPATLYTEQLSVTLPLPDFSMPYNVCTLTGTVIALFFGSTITLLARRWSALYNRKDKTFASDRPLALLRGILSKPIMYLYRRLTNQHLVSPTQDQPHARKHKNKKTCGMD